MANYYRINTEGGGSNPDANIVNEGFPYVCGNLVSGENPAATSTLNILSEINMGDFIAAGRSIETKKIGIVKQKPLFVQSTRNNGVCDGYHFEKAPQEVESLFEDVGDDDAIVIPVEWIWKGKLSTDPQGRGTMCRIRPEIQIEINKKINEYKSKKMITDIVNLLKANKNLILTGAPGTGKTFTAKEIAKQMKAETKLVQFHPAYDYTDFVEGLRPLKKEGTEKEIGFERKDGVFKEFCKKALSAFNEDKSKNENEKRKFVFIIDEINRGEISKIFGELFFSIDPSYRGERGKVQTQYQNLIEDGDVFKDGFFVPENVYIIGTMNDIDRSVESFDFAMRRRFTWQEITAEESAENMKLSEATKNKMKSLNEAISKIEGLNSSYHIGGAYFLDKDGKERTDYDKIWKLRLRPLLFEYLRGTSDAESKLENLENAYNR